MHAEEFKKSEHGLHRFEQINTDFILLRTFFLMLLHRHERHARTQLIRYSHERDARGSRGISPLRYTTVEMTEHLIPIELLHRWCERHVRTQTDNYPLFLFTYLKTLYKKYTNSTSNTICKICQVNNVKFIMIEFN